MVLAWFDTIDVFDISMWLAEPDGGCYAPKNRYISIRQPTPGLFTALRVKLSYSREFPESVGLFKWVGVPDVDGTVSLECAPAFRDWSADGPIHIGDRFIVPAATYDVQSIAEGCDIADESSYSAAVVIPTVLEWGDVVGALVSGAWTPSDNIVNFVDIQAAVNGFQMAANAAPLSWLDVHPAQPNRVINFADIQAIVNSFQRPHASYPYAGPSGCQ
jgi:hypothetical protein